MTRNIESMTRSTESMTRNSMMAYVKCDGHWGDFHMIHSRSTILAEN